MAAPDKWESIPMGPLKGATRVEAVTPGPGDLTFRPAFVMVSANTDVTMTIGGTVVILPLVAGVQYFLRPDVISAVTTGTCWILD